MKKIKVMILVFALMLIVPLTTKALTEEEMYEKLDVIPFTTVNGEKHLDVKMVDPDIILNEGRCNFTAADYNKEVLINPRLELSSEEWITEQTKLCKNTFYSNMIMLYIKSLGHDLKWSNEYFVDFDYDNPNKNQAKFTYIDEEGYGVDYDVNINYLTDINENEYETATTKLNIFDDSYSIFGMNLINCLYHYGIADVRAYSVDSMIARYPEIKEVIELNPEYDFVTRLLGGGGAPFHASFTGQVGVMKDGILYNVRDLSFHEYQIMYVDEDEDGTIFEKAERRLKEYFNNKVDVIVDGSSSWTNDGEEFDDIVNKNLGTTGVTYIGHFANVTLDDVDTHVVIVEIPKELLDIVKIRSIDKNTGVNVETSSYDVPMDATISVSDVKLSDYVKEALSKEELVADIAYDITLNRMKDGTLIRTIENGIEVYLPVGSSYKENDKVEVYYIKSDSTIGETLEGTIVKIDGKLYAKFVTNHFSTYALANKIESPVTEIENPNTYDGISNSILIFTISLIGCVCSKMYFKKTKNIKF